MPLFTPIVELALGADPAASPSTWSWTDLTQLRYVDDRSTVTIRRGRANRISEATPATLSLTLSNPSGIWVPDNPVGSYYGQFDINTPIRVSVRPGTNSATDAFNRTASSSWGSPDTGTGSWTNVGTASDYSVSPTNGGRHTNTSAASSHFSTLAYDLGRVDIRVKLRVNQLSATAGQQAGITCRYSDSSNNKRAELAFGTDQSITLRILSRSSGTDTTIATSTMSFTHSASTWYWIRIQTGVTSVRAKAWQDGTDEPATWNIDGSGSGLGFNPATTGAVGCFSRRDLTNTNAGATTDFDNFSMVDGPLIRYTGYVDSWPTSWTDASERTPMAAVTASGKLGQLQNATALKSAIYRAMIADSDLVEYWPMEDGTGATSFASAVGGNIAPFTDVQPASDSDVLGSDPLPVFGGASRVFCNVRKYAAQTKWSIRFVCKIPASPSTAAQVISWGTPFGTYVRWQVTLIPGSPDTVRIDAFTNSGSSTSGSMMNFVDSTSNAELSDGRQLYIAIDGEQNGTGIDIDWSVWYAPDSGSAVATATSQSVTFTSATLTNLNCLYFDGPNGFSSGGVTLGHIALGKAPFGAAGDAVLGYIGETTGVRFSRLCTEEGVSDLFGEILGTTSVTSEQTMGAQRSVSLYDQLREIEATENGVLFDGTQGQVTILPRSLRYNHAVNLVLDHDQGHIADGLQVARDLQLLRNSVEVTNATGFKAAALDATSIATYGVQPLPVSINAQSDSDATDHATFRLAAGKTLTRRYPSVMLQFHDPRLSSLLGSWLACDIGSRVTMANLPNTFDTADLIVDGYEEVLTTKTYTAGLNLSSADPWMATTVESTDGNLGRVDTSGCTLLAGYDSTATSLLVATTPGKRQWSTTAEPYDWGIAGERLTVTTMNTNAATFVAAGTASHGDNATLTPGLPASVTKGDLLLVFTAIRNTSATITTPTGYTALLSDTNVALFGKIHTGTESAPSVAFSGGSAGDSTSAQMAAFRYTQCTASLTASSSNASAQNIAVPAARPPLHRCVALWLGWKQDDWTSVATFSGTEIGEPSTTTGNDQGLVWDYSIQSTATEVAAGSFTVTGGANAISKGYVVWLPGDVQACTVTRSVNGVGKSQAAGTPVSLWRPGKVAQ